MCPSTQADAFGAALAGNATWRPQMTPLEGAQTSFSGMQHLAAGGAGSILVTGAGMKTALASHLASTLCLQSQGHVHEHGTLEVLQIWLHLYQNLACAAPC